MILGIPSSCKATINTEMSSCKRGSITIEAAIGLSIFIFSILILLTPMLSLKQQLHTAVILEEHSRELAKLKYLEHYGQEKGKLKLDSNLLSGLETGVSLLKLRQEINTSGMKNVDLLSETKITEEQLLFVMNYEVRVPFPFLVSNRFKKQVVSSRRAWIGAEPYRFLEEGEEITAENPLVYIGRDSENVYHTNRECSYLLSSFSTASGSSMGDRRNRFGEKYTPCLSCHPSERDAMVFFTAGGKKYHKNKSCPALQSHPHTTTLLKALEEGRHLCHRCAGH